MSDPQLLKLTASEPLTIEQEYEMQETWRHDEDSKIIPIDLIISNETLAFVYRCICVATFSECTFLVLNKAVYEQTQDEIGKDFTRAIHFKLKNRLFDFVSFQRR